MLITAINPATSSSTAASAGSSTASPLPTQTLSENDFLNLLTTELSAQDPMNPVDDTQFIGEMAQFSTLQATTGMQQNISQMGATQLIGTNVTLQNGQGSTVSGTVSGIQLSSGTPQVIVNGQPYALSTLVSVSAPTTTTTASSTTTTPSSTTTTSSSAAQQSLAKTAQPKQP